MDPPPPYEGLDSFQFLVESIDYAAKVRLLGIVPHREVFTLVGGLKDYGGLVLAFRADDIASKESQALLGSFVLVYA